MLLLLESVRMKMIFLKISSVVKRPQIFSLMLGGQNIFLVAYLQEVEIQQKGIVSCNYTVARETVYRS